MNEPTMAFFLLSFSAGMLFGVILCVLAWAFWDWYDVRRKV